MAKNSIRDYANTAASNTDVQNINIDEGCAPSGINNAIREIMADLADVNDGTIALETPVADSFSTDTISEKTAAAGVTIDGVVLKDSQVSTDTINEKTAAAGVTIDGVLLKDNEMNGSYLTDGTVATAKITDANVTTAKIADDAITTAKLATVNSDTGAKGDGTNAVTITTNAEGQVTAVSETGIGWEYIDGATGSGNTTQTFSGLSGYRTIKLLFNAEGADDFSATISGAVSDTYREIKTAYGSPVEQFTGQITIHNWNNADSPSGLKILDKTIYVNIPSGIYDISQDELSYSEAWDKVRFVLSNSANAAWRFRIFGMR